METWQVTVPGDIPPQQLSIGVQTQPTYHMTWPVPRIIES